MKRTISTLSFVGLLAVLGVLAGLATSDSQADQAGETVEIRARLRESGSVEFGLRTAEGNRFPTFRFFGASVNDGRWKHSSEIGLPNGTQVRIIARRSLDRPLEFGLRIDEPRQEFLPRQRFFPGDATVGRWLVSTPVTLPAPDAHDETDEPVPPPEDESTSTPETESSESEEPEDSGDDSDGETSEEASDVERISGTHRDGLIVNRNVIGDPDAPVLIAEYGDPY